MAETSPTRILVVADDRAHSEVLCEELRGHGHVAVAAGSVADGLEQLRQSDFEVALLDLVLPDGSGVDLLRHAAADEMAIEMIVLTASATAGAALEAMKLGAYGYTLKPTRVEELDVLVAKAAEKARLRRENATLKARLRHLEFRPGLLTEDPSMRDLLAAIERAAASEMPVLIQGETGTGKELVARAVHKMSSRAGQAFVAVHCGAVPESQMESDLFGQEKGAFAGTPGRKRGLLELAEGGVLFLDHVDRIAPAVQAKLLRAVEAKEFWRVGGTRPARADVRVFVATGTDELSQRLGGITLTLPPLRDRPADVPLLARHFVERYDGRKKLTPRALEALQRYSWPGNVRELQVLIRRAAVLAGKDLIDAEDLSLEPRDQGAKPAGRTALSLAEMEKEYIELVLRQNDGHRGKTARALGIDPKTLYNKLGPERPRKKAVAS